MFAASKLASSYALALLMTSVMGLWAVPSWAETDTQTAHVAALLGDVTAPAPAPAPPTPALVENSPRSSYLGLIGESIFGKGAWDKTNWHPLSLGTFFSEDWDEPFVLAPPGNRGNVGRGGWVDAFEGTFFRTWFVRFSYTNNFKGGGDMYVEDYVIFLPVNRRLEFRLDLPFVVSNVGGEPKHYHDDFGDMVVSPRFLLTEDETSSQLFALNIRTPTGDKVNGNDLTSLTAQYQFWWNFANNWVVRGGTGATFPTNNPMARDLSFVDIAFGRYFARQGAAFADRLFLYCSLNSNTTIDNRPSQWFSAITPGFRFQVVPNRELYFLSGIDIPLVDPPKAWDYQLIFTLLENW